MSTSPYRVPNVDDLVRPLRIIVGLLALMLLGVSIAGGVLIASLRSDEHAIVDARTQGRSSTCGVYRTFEENHNKLVDTIIRVAPKLADDFNLTKVPLHDCSEAGQKAFYDNQPRITPCLQGGDGKGYCK